MTKTKNGKKLSFYTIMGKIGDILLWPVLVISLFSSFFMLVQRKQNKVTSFFGYSFVNVLSGSMANDGFKIGDTVIVKKVNERDVKLGDIIAFYYSTSTKSATDSDIRFVTYYNDPTYPIKNDEDNITINESIDLSLITKKEDKSKEYLKIAQESKAKVYFHRVVGIYVDNDGNLFFKTKGSNNNTSDIPLTRGDLVVGEYVNTPIVVRRAVSFCASSLGMVLLVCIPLSMLVLMQCLSLIEQISVINLEKQLISGQLSYKDEIIQKELPGNLVEVHNQVYYYFITPKEEREEVKNYLWGDLKNADGLSNKKLKQLALVTSACAKLETSDVAYWDEWISNTNGGTKKQLTNYKNKLIMDKLGLSNKPLMQNTALKDNNKELTLKTNKGNDKSTKSASAKMQKSVSTTKKIPPKKPNKK